MRQPVFSFVMYKGKELDVAFVCMQTILLAIFGNADALSNQITFSVFLRQKPLLPAPTSASNYLQPPMESPPLQNSNATTKIKQQGLTLRWKFFILPPQQHKNSIINKIQVQLQPPKQPPFSQPPPQSPSLNNPLNIVLPPFRRNSAQF